MFPNIQLWFGKISIPLSQVFLIRKSVYAMVNLSPFVPGHVLVCPIKRVDKLEDLQEPDFTQLFLTAHQVCQKLETIHKTPYEIACQNGKEAGQTVKHVHLHLLPKHQHQGIQRQEDRLRTSEQMANQAAIYRTLFEHHKL